MQTPPISITITVRQARPDDARHIHTLLEREDLDCTAFDLDDFVVAEDHTGRLAGCARLKSYGDCVELSSVAVQHAYRGYGVGSRIITTLLQTMRKPVIHLVCEPREVPFFSRFGFCLLAREEAPTSLESKLQSYEVKVGVMVVMRRVRRAGSQV